MLIHTLRIQMQIVEKTNIYDQSNHASTLCYINCKSVSDTRGHEHKIPIRCRKISKQTSGYMTNQQQKT